MAARLRFDDVIDLHGLRNDYERGYVDALLSVAYSTSEAWAESGVLYVGTTGSTLAEVVNEFLEERREPVRCPRCEGAGDAIPQLPHTLGCPEDDA